jgi:hypothetical protein
MSPFGYTTTQLYGNVITSIAISKSAVFLIFVTISSKSEAIYKLRDSWLSHWSFWRFGSTGIRSRITGALVPDVSKEPREPSTQRHSVIPEKTNPHFICNTIIYIANWTATLKNVPSCNILIINSNCDFRIIIKVGMKSFITCTNAPNIIWVIISRRMRWVRHVARMGRKINSYKVSNRKYEIKRPLGKPKRRIQHNIKMYLK